MTAIDAPDLDECAISNMRVTAKDPRALLLVAEALDRNGSLSAAAVRDLTAKLRCSRASIYRLREKVLAGRQSVPAPEDLTSFQAMELYGAKGFRFDEEMLVLYGILGCNQTALRDVLKDANYDVPSPATICRRLKELPPRTLDSVRYGLKNRNKFRLVRRFESSAPYELFQIDEFQLPVDVLVPLRRLEKPVGEDGTPVEVYQPDGPGGRRYQVMQPRLLLLIDDFSRYVVSYAVLYKRAATMVDTLALLAHAFLKREIESRVVGGAPEMIGTDNGGALVGSLIQSFLGLTATGLEIAAGYSPQSPCKAKVEANGKQIKRLIATGVAGRRTQAETIDGYDLAALEPSMLMRADAFTKHVEARMKEWNHERAHTSTGEVPFDRVTRDGVLGTPVPDEVLAKCFLPNDVDRPDRLSKEGIRHVDKQGVRLHDGDYYSCPEFFDYIGSQVEIRTLHHDRDYSAAFTLEGRFIGIVKSANAWTEEDEKRRYELSTQAETQTTRIHKRMRDCVAGAMHSHPDDLVQGAARLLTGGADLPDAKSAKRDVVRPRDLAPSRREIERNYLYEEASVDATDLEGALAAMGDQNASPAKAHEEES